MPTPLDEGSHVLDPLLPDFAREHEAERVPPEPYGFVADIGAVWMAATA